MNEKSTIKNIFDANNIDYNEHDGRIVLHGGTEGVIAREFCDRAVCFSFEEDGSLKDIRLVG
jgi:hypothetical protein